MDISRMNNCLSQNVGKVKIGRKKSSWLHWVYFDTLFIGRTNSKLQFEFALFFYPTNLGHGLISGQTEALWLRIISKPFLSAKKVVEGQLLIFALFCHALRYGSSSFMCHCRKGVLQDSLSDKSEKYIYILPTKGGQQQRLPISPLKDNRAEI